MARQFSSPEDRLVMANFVEDLARWQVYFTGTFVFECRQDSARRCYEKFMERGLPSVTYFYALELNGHGWHVHALWSGTDQVFRRDVWAKWFDRYGINRILPIRQRASDGFTVAKYCAKYLCKEGAWWNTNARPAGERQPPSPMQRSWLLRSEQSPPCRDSQTAIKMRPGATVSVSTKPFLLWDGGKVKFFDGCSFRRLGEQTNRAEAVAWCAGKGLEFREQLTWECPAPGSSRADVLGSRPYKRTRIEDLVDV
jgi:hypothetical protein